MINNPYEGIRVVLAEPQSSLRMDYKDVLVSLGCRQIIETGNIRDVCTAFKQGGVDVLIGNTTLPEGSLSEVVHQIRHGVIGDNPFIIAMVLVSKSEQSVIDQVIESGADDILIKPLSADQLRDRLLLFTRTRKRFVVTSDYIGPDRRQKLHSEGMAVPLIKVPNPLLVRMSAGVGSGQMKRAVARSQNEVNEQKVERHAYSVHWLMERLVEVQNGDLSASDLNMEKEFSRLNEMASDITRRLTGTDYHHAAELCLTLERMSALLRETPDLAGRDELSLMSKLTAVIKRKCGGIDPVVPLQDKETLEDEPASAVY